MYIQGGLGSSYYAVHARALRMCAHVRVDDAQLSPSVSLPLQATHHATVQVYTHHTQLLSCALGVVSKPGRWSVRTVHTCTYSACTTYIVLCTNTRYLVQGTQ